MASKPSIAHANSTPKKEYHTLCALLPSNIRLVRS